MMSFNCQLIIMTFICFLSYNILPFGMESIGFMNIFEPNSPKSKALPCSTTVLRHILLGQPLQRFIHFWYYLLTKTWMFCTIVRIIFEVSHQYHRTAKQLVDALFSSSFSSFLIYGLSEFQFKRWTWDNFGH